MKGKSILKKWFKNVSYTLVGKIAAMLFFTLLDISAARFLSVDSYAEWVYFFAVLTMLFYVGWFGINNSAKVFVSKCGDDTKRINCMAASLTLRLGVSLLIAFLITVFFPQAASMLGYPDKYPNLKWLFGISGVLVFLNSFIELFKGLMIGTNEFKKLATLTVTEYVGYFLFSSIGLFLYRKVEAIAFGYFASGILVVIMGCTMIYRQNKGSLSLLDRTFTDQIFPILKYAIPIALISFGGLILVEMDTFMLGLLSTKENVAVYNIAKNLCSKATHVNYALTVGVMTSFSVITAKNIAEKKQEFKKATFSNLAVALFVSVCFLIFADLAIGILYGSEYARSGGLLRLLVVYYALYAISNFFSSFLDFRGKAGSRSLWYISVVVINLVLNYLWIPQYGAVGAAIATDLSLVPYTVYVIVKTSMEWKEKAV